MILRAICLLIALVIGSRCEARALDEANLDNFKQAFNQASDNVRLVALLSPT